MHNSGTISPGKDFAPSNVPSRIISASSLQLFQGNVHPEKSHLNTLKRVVFLKSSFLNSFIKIMSSDSVH